MTTTDSAQDIQWTFSGYLTESFFTHGYLLPKGKSLSKGIIKVLSDNNCLERYQNSNGIISICIRLMQDEEYSERIFNNKVPTAGLSPKIRLDKEIVPVLEEKCILGRKLEIGDTISLVYSHDNVFLLYVFGTGDKEQTKFSIPLTPSFYNDNGLLSGGINLIKYLDQFAIRFFEFILIKPNKSYDIQIIWKENFFSVTVPKSKRSITENIDVHVPTEIQESVRATIPLTKFLKEEKEKYLLILEFNRDISVVRNEPIFNMKAVVTEGLKTPDSDGKDKKKDNGEDDDKKKDNGEDDDKKEGRRILGENFLFKPDHFDLSDLVLSNVDVLKRKIAYHLNNGDNLIFIGPPGTGKTVIAEQTCKAAVDCVICVKYVITTATSDWSSFETIGGYFPNQKSLLEFHPGHFLSAIERNSWIILDEINRADIDKTFGSFFTVLSKKNVDLPFRRTSKSIGREDSDVIHKNNLRILYDSKSESKFDIDKQAYVFGKNWRIIGTMNSFDKFSLFSLSYAFMRRFAFISIPIPEKEDMLILLKKWDKKSRFSSNVIEVIERLSLRDIRPIGPAVLESIVKYLYQCSDTDLYEGLLDAFEAYVLPQLEGLQPDLLNKVVNILKEIFEGKLPNYKEILSKMFEERFGGNICGELQW